LDLLEGEGIIGPADGAKPREILVSDQDEADNQYQEQNSEDSDLSEEEKY
jgi:DNA segregation ATPase FtsK/SpoIIIE-like protein